MAFPDQRCRLEGHAAAEVPPSSTNMCKYRNSANVTKKITSCCFPSVIFSAWLSLLSTLERPTHQFLLLIKSSNCPSAEPPDLDSAE